MSTDRVKNVLEIVVRSAELGKYDSNVIGMAAEVIAEERFGMQKAPRGSRDIDGHRFVDGQRQTVQVKAWSEDRIRSYKQFTYFRLREASLPDVLLCILVYSSRPDYRVIYHGSPREIGYVEKNGKDRVIRFADLMQAEIVQEILTELGAETVAKPRALKPQTPLVNYLQKPCSICGTTFGREEFTYGGRSTNSYCKTCRKAVGAAYNRGGTQAANEFRREMRSKWKS